MGKKKADTKEFRRCWVESGDIGPGSACLNQKCPNWVDCQKRRENERRSGWVNVYLTEETVEWLLFYCDGYNYNHDYRMRPSEKFCFRMTVTRLSLDEEGSERWLDLTVMPADGEYLEALDSIRLHRFRKRKRRK